MIQLKPCRDLSALSRVIKSVGCYQVGAEPKSGVPISLNDGEKPALGDGVHHDLRVVPVSPLRNFGMVVDAVAVFRLRAKFHVVRIAARAIAAQVVKRQTFRDWAVSLRPLPAVATPCLTIAAEPSVSVVTGRQFPTSCLLVDNVPVLPAVAGIIHLRLTRDVPQPRKLSYRRRFTAAAQANPIGVANSLGDGRHRMAFNELRVASPNGAVGVVGADGRLPSTAALAKAGWVGASGVIGQRCLATAKRAAVVTLQVARLFGQQLPATARAWGFRAGRLNRFGLFVPGSHLMAVNETAPARKPAVGALRKFAASARARLAIVDMGHMISSKDLWFGLAGAQTLCQPFHCTVKVT
jgi:hypothetical protein